MSNTHPHIGEPTCPTPARLSPGESLAAPARTGQGEGTDMILGELTAPEGFWFSCHCFVCWFPSSGVRSERRA